MKCERCGRRESTIRGGLIGTAPGTKKTYLCSRCHRSDVEAKRALVQGQRCQICGRANPPNYSYSTNSDGTLKTFLCIDCDRANERKANREKAARENHDAVLTEIWNTAESRRHLSVRDASTTTSGTSMIEIAYESPHSGWAGKKQVIRVYVSVHGNQVVGTHPKSGRIQPDEVFRVTVGPACAEQVVNLVLAFAVPRK